MSEGFRQEIERKEVEIAKLPKYWNFQEGLVYPLTLTLISGSIVKFKNYKEHHAFISALFRPNHER